MSRETKPWLPLYVDDFLGDETVKLASNRALGAYVKLLCHQWTHKSIPGNPDELARLIGESSKNFAPIWKILRAKFQEKKGRWEEKNGRLVNQRLEVERRKADSVLRARRKAARSTNAHRDGDRNGDRKQNGRRPGGETQTHPQTHNTNYTAEFEEAWKAYPERRGGNSKRGAYRQWCARLAEGVTAETMLAGTKRYAAELGAEGKLATPYVKLGATFYGRDRHFEYEEITVTPIAKPPTTKMVVDDSGTRLRLIEVPLSDPRPAA